MKLNQPYYIEPRNGDAHIDLGGKWDFCWRDSEIESPESDMWEYSATLPKSIYYCLYEADILPHPYYGTNSKQYHWVDEKVWYFKKNFTLSRPDFDGNAFLCFDGVSYYSKLWVNGKCFGDHEGMFGGPCTDIASVLNTEGENEIVIEIKAANFGKKEGYDFRNYQGVNREIIPWNIVRDTLTSSGDFIVMGIWNTVRLELVNKKHISRPYIVTKSADSKKAELHLELQIADGRLKELVPFVNAKNVEYINSYYTGFTAKTLDDSVDIEVVFKDGEDIVYKDTDNVKLTDFEGLLMDERCYELQYYLKDFEIENPKLWYPNGLGEPHLYRVEISLLYKGKRLDMQSFDYGIRTFSADYTKGNKYRSKWNKFLYSVNGKQIFLKGINWTPIDFLYSVDEDRYKWCLTLIKNAGIQLIRVWSGGGFPETDTFYRLCDKLGIMVWQDDFIANTEDTHSWPHDVLEAQTAYNLYRLRKHTSLVIHCGGNEHNPYSPGNSASAFVMKRTAEALDPHRIYYNTTPDGGSVHMYRTMEPVWYRHIYKLPFLAESGIHSFPSYITLKKLLDKNETEGILPDIISDEFVNKYPGLLNHFSEYIPLAIERMTSRISQISNMAEITLEELCEASHVQSYEFYQLMIQSMQENYPICGGVMPWVFKRPWPTVGIQTVDGDDRPVLSYYSIKNAYSPVNVCFCQQWSVLAPNEPIELKVKVFNQNEEDLSGTDVHITIFNPDLTINTEYTEKYDGRAEYNFGTFIPDNSFTNTCFLISCEVSRDGEIISRSVYFNKCTDILSDEKLYKEYREAPIGNLSFDHGPWLKECLQKARRSSIDAKVINTGTDSNGYSYSEILLENSSDIPAYPVTLGLCDESKKWFLSENFFILMPNERKTVRITSDNENCGKIYVNSWNCDSITI